MYLSHYGLKTEPFQLTPDPQFLQLADAHRSALSILFQGVLMRKGFLVLTGPIGTGKTTILHAVMHILNDQAVSKAKLSTAFVVNPTLTRDEFLEFVEDEFQKLVSSQRRIDHKCGRKLGLRDGLIIQDMHHGMQDRGLAGANGPGQNEEAFTHENALKQDR